MSRFSKKTKKLFFSTIVAECYILSALVIPALHRLEVYHPHDTFGEKECCHYCDSDHNIEKIKNSSFPKHKKHNPETCSICFFGKYLSGIKDYTLFPNGKTLIRITDTFTLHVELFAPGFIQFYFASRAPPL